MKKLFILIILLMLTLSVSAAWRPGITISNGLALSKIDGKIDKTNALRSSYRGGVDISLISFDFGNRHRLAIPIGVSYYSRTPSIDRLFIQERIGLDITLEYDYSFTNLFALGAIFGGGYMAYPLINAGSLYLEYGIAALFNFNKVFSLSVPLRCVSAPGEITVFSGVSLSFYFPHTEGEA